MINLTDKIQGSSINLSSPGLERFIFYWPMYPPPHSQLWLRVPTIKFSSSVQISKVSQMAGCWAAPLPVTFLDLSISMEPASQHRVTFGIDFTLCNSTLTVCCRAENNIATEGSLLRWFLWLLKRSNDKGLTYPLLRCNHFPRTQNSHNYTRKSLCHSSPVHFIRI